MSTKKSATRDAVLEAAWKRLERGDAARLEDVATDAGVSRQAVYLHFESRGGLLLALVEHIDTKLGLYGRLEEVNAIRDPVERLVATVGLTADYQPKIHAVGMAMYHAARTDDAVRRAYDDRMALRRAGLVEILEALEKRKRLVGPWSVIETADILWAAGAPTSYEQLVVQRGWRPGRYKAWLQALARSFVKAAPRAKS